MTSKITKTISRTRRHARIRAKIKGTEDKPRLCVFRSNKHIYAQLINDVAGNTLLSSATLKLSGSKGKGKTGKAFETGKLLAEEALKKGIKKVSFDRGGYNFHGRVKALAEGAREGGLEF